MNRRDFLKVLGAGVAGTFVAHYVNIAAPIDWSVLQRVSIFCDPMQQFARVMVGDCLVSPADHAKVLSFIRIDDNGVLNIYAQGKVIFKMFVHGLDSTKPFSLHFWVQCIEGPRSEFYIDDFCVADEQDTEIASIRSI